MSNHQLSVFIEKNGKYFQIKTLVFLLVSLLAALTFSCSKDSHTPVPDVYLAGIPNGDYQKAVYWKNGVIDTLSKTRGTFAFQIAVSGADIYVLGSTVGSVPAFWKNGVETGLYGGGSAFALSGSDVYVLGDNGMYWKNGQLNPLSGNFGAGYFPSIAVQNSDVFVAGTLFYPYGSSSAYWKNDTRFILTDTSNKTSSTALYIAVSGNDVYVAGAINNKPTYWKNGVSNILADNGVVTQMVVSGSDVYISGYIHPDSSTSGLIQPVYWKNGNLNILQGSISAHGIAVSGSDVYVIGNSYVGLGYTNNGNGSIIWKNGVPSIFDGYIFGIWVQ